MIYLPFLIKKRHAKPRNSKNNRKPRWRRGYEEKRASKLGFTCLYDYFEYKISKKQKAIENKLKETEATRANNQPKAAKKRCGCC